MGTLVHMVSPREERWKQSCRPHSLEMRTKQRHFSQYTLSIFCILNGVTVLLFLFLKKKIYLFIWLHRVLVAACGIFSWGMRDPVPWPGIEPGPLHWERGVLATGPPGKSLAYFSKPNWIEILRKESPPNRLASMDLDSISLTSLTGNQTSLTESLSSSSLLFASISNSSTQHSQPLWSGPFQLSLSLSLSLSLPSLPKPLVQNCEK